MSAYTKYTLRKNIPTPFEWKCPRCNRNCVGAHIVAAYSTYTSQGIGFGQKAKERLMERKQLAEEALGVISEKKLNDAVEKFKNEKWFRLDLRSKCNFCKKIPAWSNAKPLPIYILSMLTAIIGGFMFFVGLLCLIGGIVDKDIKYLGVGLLLCVPMLIYGIVEFVSYKSRKKKLKTYSEEQKPQIKLPN